MFFQPKPLTRRNFLQFTTGIGAAIAIDQLVPKALQASIKQLDGSYPDIVDLTIKETELTIGDRQATALTVNNTLPGQLIRLKEGQKATIKVTNKLKVDTSIHWHGIILPPNMDGVPGISFGGIKPGETFTYNFDVNQNGTYWYHSHSGLQEQQGHFGGLIIDPLEPEPFTYDQDYIVLLSDWTFEDPHQILANLKKMSPFYNYQRRTVSTLGEDQAWRRMRMDPTDIADVTGATYTYLMNGTAPDDNWTALFKQGEKVRLRFVNASAMTFFDVRIPGLKMTVVQADGQNVAPVAVDEFRIGTAETYDVIVEPDGQNAYTIFAETMDRSGFAKGTLAVEAGLTAAIPPQRERPLRTMEDMGMDHSGMSSMDNSGMAGMDHSGMSGMNNSGMAGMDHSGMDHSNIVDTTPVPHGMDDHGSGNSGVPMMVKNRLNEPGIGLGDAGRKVLVYTDLRSLAPWSKPRTPDRELELHLTGNMERYMWSFDGKKYSEEKELIFYNGERLKLTFVNDTMMEHPIHLHGMWMELDNGAGAYKPRKHTLIVKPAEKCSTEINVDAPGKWAFHCHLLYHMEVGMFRTVAVVDRA